MWVVCDGLGGHRGGEVAAHLAVEAILGAFRDRPGLAPEDLGGYLEAADRAIGRRRAAAAELDAMRTTAVLLASDGRRARWAHLGDSRLYRLRGGRVAAQTRDHSVPQAMVEAGDLRPEQVRGHEDRNRLLRALGGGGPVRASVAGEALDLATGDAFLLCTDGFWEHVLEAEMAADLVEVPGEAPSDAPAPEAWLARMARRLAARAPADADNRTAVAVVVRP